MTSTRRKKALIGLGFWIFSVALIILAVIFRPKRPGATSPLGDFEGIFALGGLVGCYASYFWGCYNLAKAKGYSGAVVLIGLLGPLAQLGVFVGLMTIQDRNSSKPHRRRSSRPHSQISRTEYIVRCSRNALLGVLFGIVGILAGIILVVFRLGIFQTHENEFILGMFVFGAGYAAVIAGCWWWVKAKQWTDAVVFIGLMPLAVFFIPWVRLVFFLNLRLTACCMVMMPLILVVVVAVLPDRSGWAQRKRWRIREQGVASEETETTREIR